MRDEGNGSKGFNCSRHIGHGDNVGSHRCAGSACTAALPMPPLGLPEMTTDRVDFQVSESNPFYSCFVTNTGTEWRIGHSVPMLCFLECPYWTVMLIEPELTT
jgi:hypothetical protein